MDYVIPVAEGYSLDHLVDKQSQSFGLLELTEISAYIQSSRILLQHFQQILLYVLKYQVQPSFPAIISILVGLTF